MWVYDYHLVSDFTTITQEVLAEEPDPANPAEVISTTQTVVVRAPLETPRRLRGYIAEEVPDRVAGPERKSINVMGAVATNTAALQEAKRRIVELEARLAALEALLQQQQP